MTRLFAAIAAAALALSTPSLAAGQAVSVERGLPEICTRDAGDMHAGMKDTDEPGMAMTSHQGMPTSMPDDMGAMSNAGRAMMKGMGDMDRDMAIGMTAKDPDVAFLCGMIPHHRGAIAMARAELEYGKDTWSKKLAKAIIAAQEKEIREMLDKLATMN